MMRSTRSSGLGTRWGWGTPGVWSSLPTSRMLWVQPAGFTPAQPVFAEPSLPAWHGEHTVPLALLLSALPVFSLALLLQ